MNSLKRLTPFLTLALLLPACNLTSQARVESIKQMNEGIEQLNNNNMSGAERALNEAIKTDPTHAPSDRVELSDHARLLDEIRRLPDVRTERVQQVRDALDAGTYETEERLNTAIERLLEDLGE